MNRCVVLRAAIVGVLVTAWAVAAPGTLDPPEGPVAGTGRTLDEIYNKIEATEFQIASLAEDAGPWDSYTVFPSSDNFTSDEIVPGRVHVHSVTVHYADVVVFDGAGTIDSNTGNATEGDPIGFARAEGARGQGGNYGANSVSTVLDVIVEDGMHVAWNIRQSPTGITILYRQLD